jgi:aspartyl-tRNA(Asn)/glutamyl-tRNA(Gln) amidotransferase subunit A
VADLTDLTIAEAGAALLAGRVSSTDLVEATLARIAETDPHVHAYVVVFADQARQAARQADRELAIGRPRGPLHGIPIAVKDLCHLRDAPTEAGSRAMAGFAPGFDATVVRRLLDAGAIVVGKTVTHEFAYGVNTPPTRNPWDPDRYPGGSSAGSGVAVAVRSAFGAIGTDTGGSIRVPAAIEGIVGLKPTYGRVSRHGVVGLGSSLDHVGPMTRTVEDNAIMLQAMAGPDPRDLGSADAPVPDFRAGLDAGADGMTIGVDRDYFFYGGVAEDVRRATDSVLDTLRELGARVVEVRLPELAISAETLMTIMAAEASVYHRRRLRERPADYDAATRQSLQLGEFIPATHYLLAQRARAVLRGRMANLFHAGRLDAIVSPTMPLTAATFADLFAPRPDWPSETPMLSYIHHTFSANLTGQPALSLPCGVSADGQPIGVQLLGRPFDEPTIFRLARAYEATAPWSALKPDLERCRKATANHPGAMAPPEEPPAAHGRAIASA